jgi:hypothetical protein
MCMRGAGSGVSTHSGSLGALPAFEYHMCFLVDMWDECVAQALQLQQVMAYKCHRRGVLLPARSHPQAALSIQRVLIGCKLELRTCVQQLEPVT